MLQRHLNRVTGLTPFQESRRRYTMSKKSHTEVEYFEFKNQPTLKLL